MMWRFSFKKQKQKPHVYDAHTHTQTHTSLGVSQARQHTATKFFFASRISGLSININHHFLVRTKNLSNTTITYLEPKQQKSPSFDWHVALVLEGWKGHPQNFPDISKFPQVPRSGAWAQTSKASSQSSGIKKWRPDREVPKRRKAKERCFFWLKQLQ